MTLQKGIFGPSDLTEKNCFDQAHKLKFDKKEPNTYTYVTERKYLKNHRELAYALSSANLS